MKRLPAFTLLEAVLSLFLTALLGVFAMYILQDLSQGGRSMGQRALVHEEALHLSTAVRADMASAHEVRINSNGELECIHGTGGVRYRILPDRVLRVGPDGSETDFDLLGGTATYGYHSAGELVCCWNLTFTESDPKCLAFRKDYPPAQLYRAQHPHGHQHSH